MNDNIYEHLQLCRESIAGIEKYIDDLKNRKAPKSEIREMEKLLVSERKRYIKLLRKAGY
ncbi:MULTISPECIES: hypothetical protein [unclassified Campylobacter]|uniref:hypothetical protein n=1 Tax=unclassified Campylobacter TaxID=2593542 RepID=UPI0022E9E0AA|nr:MULTISPECIES: hypothetical protein [unclassified Campylobacter]MDA3056449.1 hypothetical protein [Campylobacter sp. CN_NA1]MDA3069382.1 hypothetical protein [Campylobacter sp. CN_NE3]